MSSPHGPQHNAPPQVPPANLPPLQGGYQLAPAPQNLGPTPLYTGPPKRTFEPAEKPAVHAHPITNRHPDPDRHGIDVHRARGRERKAAERDAQPGHEHIIAPYRKIVDLGHIAIQGSERHGENVGQPVTMGRRVRAGLAAGGLAIVNTATGVLPVLAGIGLAVRGGANKNLGRDNPFRRRYKPREGEQPHTYNKSGRFSGPSEYANPGYPLHPLPQPHQPNPNQGGNQGGNQQPPQPRQSRRQRRQAPQTQQQQQPPQPQNPNQNQQQPQQQPNRRRRRGGGQPQPTSPQPTAGNRNRRTPQTPPAQPAPGTQGNQPPNPNTGRNQPQPTPNRRQRPTFDPNDVDGYLRAVGRNIRDPEERRRWSANTFGLPPEERARYAENHANAMNEIDRRAAQRAADRARSAPEQQTPVPPSYEGPSAQAAADYRRQYNEALSAGKRLPTPSWNMTAQELTALGAAYSRQVAEANQRGVFPPAPPAGLANNEPPQPGQTPPSNPNTNTGRPSRPRRPRPEGL